MISAEKLSCGYGENTVLHDVTFALAAHRHLTVLGSNGSGKSTLAKAISGLIPYGGSLQIQDRQLSEIPMQQRAKLISYIPEKVELFEQYTSVEDFVLMGRYAHKQAYKNYTSSDAEIVKNVLKSMKLEDLAEQNMHTLSSGQQQLVLIAQALVQESAIIIFDEPTANLDPSNSIAFAAQLGVLQTKGMTTILITHDLNLAKSMEGSILFAEEGSTHYFQDSRAFFTEENLQKHYGIAFNSRALGVNYG